MTEDRDRKLADLYRQSSQETPPVHVDRAILEQARKSARRKVYAPFGSNWLAGGAMVGVIILSVLLVLDVPREEADMYLPAPPPPPMPDAEAPMDEEIMQADEPPLYRLQKMELQQKTRAEKPVAPTTALYLQTDLFHDRAGAVALQERLTALGIPCEVREIRHAGTDTVYRVHIGPFADVAARDQEQQKLRDLGIVTQPMSGEDQEDPVP